MHALNKFIAIWEKDQDIEALIEAGVAIPSADEIKNHLETLDPAARDQILASLGEAANAIELYARSLQKEAASIKNEIGKTHDRSKALLVYNLSQFKTNKNRS